MRRIFEILGRIYGGTMLSIFAFAPGWIGFSILYQIILRPSNLDLVAATAMSICFALLYFLLLLAYRAFTGRGRSTDGGLLPPWAMKIFVAVFGVIAIAITVFGFYTGKLGAIIGGMVSLTSALTIYGTLKWRHERHRLDA